MSIQPINPPSQATAIQQREPPQGCLKIAAITASRLLIHSLILFVRVTVLRWPVAHFMRFYEEKGLLLPAATVLIVNMSFAVRRQSIIFIPLMILLDGMILTVLQLPPRPWRYLARVWYSAVLIFAVLFLALSVFALSLPIDQVLPPDQRMYPEDPITAAGEELPNS